MKILLWLFLFSVSLSAQTTIQWEKSYGGSEYDQATYINQTPDGGYIVAGFTTSNDFDVTGNHGLNDFWIIKLNAIGEMVWQKALGGADIDWLLGAQVTSDGGCIAVGFTNSYEGDIVGFQGNSDVWVVKIGPNGDFEWQKTLGGYLSEEAWDVQETSDGGFIVVGWSNSKNGDVMGNHGTSDYWVIKLSQLGDLEWQKCLGGSKVDVADAVKQTPDGGFIVVGQSNSIDGDVIADTVSNDFWIVKLDVLGTIEWQKKLGSSVSDYPTDIIVTSDGGYVFAGWVGDGGDVIGYHGGYIDAWVVKLDQQGEVLWTKALGGSKEDYVISIQQTTDGGFILVGDSNSSDGDVLGNDGGEDLWLVKLTPQGDVKWQKTMGGSFQEYGQYVSQTEDGGFIVAGSNRSSDGDASTNKGYFDYWIVKLSPETIATGGQSTLPLKLFPNPSTGIVTLQLPFEAALFQVQIIDLQGLIVLNQTGSNTTFDLAPFPKGNYLITARSESGQMWVGKVQKI